MTEADTGLRNLSDDECWAHLHRTRIGRLAVNNGNQPDIFPVNYVIDDGKVIVRTAEGTKLAAAIATGNVAFEIDGIDDEAQAGWSVVVHGVACEPRTVEAVLHDHSLELEPWARAGSKLRFIEITPARVAGRAVGGDVQDS